jgi:hypothetical protein
MTDAPTPNEDLPSKQRKIGFLALTIAWVAVLAMFFFYERFGRRVTIQVVVMGVGALAMFIVASRVLSRTKRR